MMCQMIYQVHKKEETNETIQPISPQVQDWFQWNADWQKRDLLPQFLNAMFYNLASLPIVLHMVLLPSMIGSPGFPPPAWHGGSLPACIPWCCISVAHFYRWSYFWKNLLDGNNLVEARWRGGGKCLLLQKDVIGVADLFLKVRLFFNVPTVALRPHWVALNFKRQLKGEGFIWTLFLTNTYSHVSY